MKDFLESVQRLATEFRISDDFDAGDLHIATYDFEKAADVASWVVQAGLVSGWSILWGRESTVWLAIDPDAFDLKGMWPGDGEFVGFDEASQQIISLHVRHLGPFWRCTAFARRERALACFGAATRRKIITGLRQPRAFLVDERFQEVSTQAGLSARYHIWWVDDDVTGFGPAVDVFAGFHAEPHVKEEFKS